MVKKQTTIYLSLKKIKNKTEQMFRYYFLLYLHTNKSGNLQKHFFLINVTISFMHVAKNS
jgi:hypothetical protein